ncbi:MAG TPA: cation-translocating P-type ATPase [Candidatus Scybalocola faecigallinarum]|uniref:Cation-translocating P-type ATPase n=1 Tax=Candidatus Scybalocola faecigallinarum TaxID=2840941 RepID=A0A9D1F465_9FIRM|nr:cation-translocating P-type ATPase [Candidatus Scybalocola faecigallinarum]
MKEFYQMTKDEALAALNASENGLSDSQAAAALETYGENALTEQKKKSLLQVFLGQFADLLVIILIVAAVVSMVSGNVESTIVIIAVIILNAILGTVQYAKAEKSLDSLKALSSPKAKVLREGQKHELDSKNVVPGDILLLEAGDMVCADGRILYNYSLQVNESSLTGESTNVDKKEVCLDGEMPLGDRVNMVYSGSLVTYGRATVLVTGTGMKTEIGKIATLMNETKEKKTPLQISLDQFSKKLAIIILVICALVLALSLYRDMSFIDSLMFAVALAVAAIPEALSSIVTIVQAIGTQKMVKEHAVVKELKAVESLGCVSVICSDKTGTLTQNKMTVQQIYIDGQLFTPFTLDLKNQLHRFLLYDAILSNDSTFQEGKGMGDPTEYCLLEMAENAGVDHSVIRELMPRKAEIPFDSDRKLMSTKYNMRGKLMILTKGAVDVLLSRTDRIAFSDGVRPITEEDRQTIMEQNNKFSENGLRVLAFGYKDNDETEPLTLDDEQDFVFLGLVSIIDPPREESKAAVADATRAGIKTVMITGDHKVTAAAIAKQIGIFKDGDLAITGSELDAMSDEELDQKIESISVYARVSPENKIRIVDAWQRKGRIVSMTGDGVNDAPALKKADIGVAMGITGTEVSKDAASMILQDDNFATIIKAVANGRNVYRNIKNAIQFLLSGNTAAILAVLYTSIAGLAVPFQAVHLLFINLLTDSLPAIAIGMEPADKDILSEKPRNPKEGILNRPFMINLAIYGILIAVCTMVSYHIGLGTDAATASTMAFATLTIARLFHGFNCRSNHSIFGCPISRNWWCAGAFVLGLLLINMVLFIPGLHGLFEVSNLTGTQIGWIYLMAFIPTLIIQIAKLIREHVK